MDVDPPVVQARAVPVDRVPGRGGGRFGFGNVGRARTGDRVQILNYVAPNPNEEWSDRDQVGVVARVTKARVHIQTDSGQMVQRGFVNVEVISPVFAISCNFLNDR